MAQSSVLPMGGKPADYFENPRTDLIERLPRPMGRVLDVGCGAGGVGRYTGSNFVHMDCGAVRSWGG